MKIYMNLEIVPRVSLKLHDCLKKEPKATKCSDQRTVSLIAHTEKIVARVLRKRIDRKI
jgi:hypothetical protein